MNADPPSLQTFCHKRVMPLALLLVAAVGCQSTAPSPTSGDGVFAVPAQEDSHHRLRYQDGQLSRTDSCMIRLGNRLNHRVPPLYVNGEPMGFC
ncbi:MAG: hypothetical protein ACI9EF_002200 [Pseudohongiellaceae bacterium]|jgi:hypothetical protein